MFLRSVCLIDYNRMINRKWIYGILIALTALAAILTVIISYSFNSRDLKVIFIDVGQGDAILITQGSHQVLIDGGWDENLVLEKLGKFIPFWDRQIEAVVATHPDKDHIGGIIGILKAYEVKAIIQTSAHSPSQIYTAFEEAVKNEKANQIEALKGMKIKFSNKALLEVIYPSFSAEDSNSNSSNETSVVARFDFGESSFLFTGDLPSSCEKNLEFGEIDFLKVAHHGSKYSTSAEFLDKIKPREAIISAGKNNSYGHPHRETLERLWGKAVKIWRTDEVGDIVYRCQARSMKCEIVL